MCQYTSILAGAVLLSLGCAPRGTPTHLDPPPSGPVLITHVSIIDPATGTTRSDQSILIVDGRIRAISDARGTTPTSGVVTRDASGLFVIPGLWDAHVHLGLEGGAWALAQYIAHGVTGVRDMGTNFGYVDSLRRAIGAGRIVGPRVLAAGPMIESAESMRGILANVTPADSARARRDRVQVDNPRRAIQVVDSLSRLGVDMIKARTIVDGPTYWAIAGAARRANLRFVGHPAAPSLNVDHSALADSGQRTIEHWYYPGDLATVPETTFVRIAARYQQKGVALVPTISAWHQHRLTVDSLRRLLSTADARATTLPLQLRQHWEQELHDRLTEVNGQPATEAQLSGWRRALDQFGVTVGRLANAGMLVVAGSDLAFAQLPGAGLANELEFLVREGGLTPAQALASATINAATAVGVQDSVGVVAPGMRADLVLLSANPLLDISNVRAVRAVLLNGRWVHERKH